jgi:hypothetical protein
MWRGRENSWRLHSVLVHAVGDQSDSLGPAGNNKQRELLDGAVHLVEMDLLRGGEHATAVPKDLALTEAGPSVRRFDRQDEFLVYPIGLEQRLPTIDLPLLPDDPGVPLDLQALLDRAYDAGPYRREIRYGEDAFVPPLRPDQAAWAAAIPGRPRP